MIGGVVIDVAPRDGGRVRLWCAARSYTEDGRSTGLGADECGVYVSARGEIPDIGDDVWWQGEHVLWTPRDRRFTDRKLVKIGYSSSSAEMLTGLIEQDASISRPSPRS